MAAFLAACIAFGRVQSFLPVAQKLLNEANHHGGPAHWAMTFNRENAQAIAHIQYRWVRGQDFALLMATLGAALRQYGRIGALFEPQPSIEIPHIGPLLEEGIGRLHQLAQDEAKRLGLPPRCGLSKRLRKSVESAIGRLSLQADVHASPLDESASQQRSDRRRLGTLEYPAITSANPIGHPRSSTFSNAPSDISSTI